MTDLESLAGRPDVTTTADTVALDPGAFETVRENVRAGRDRWVGALLRDGDGRVALVRNRWSDGWVLPGGTVERGETLREALVREVREETGLEAGVERPLEVVEQTFVAGDETTTGYFVVFEARAATTEFGDDLGVDASEIEAAAWFGSAPDRCEDAGILRRHL